MQRRKFIKETSVAVLGISAWGNIILINHKYVGDTATTSDVLGPFYRPGAPLRTDLNPIDFKGNVLHLYGQIVKEDNETPVHDCLIEIWQCRPDGYYDNISEQFAYRGSQKIGTDGKYSFYTTKPVPEPVDEQSKIFRPAHIHLRISSIGEQDLITQIYFTADPYLESDPSTKSPISAARILSIKKISDNKSELNFDIVLKKPYLPTDELFRKVSGIYKMSDNSMMEFYREGDLLFYKTNNQIWGSLSYAGGNRFVGGVNDTEAVFEMLVQGKVKLHFTFIRRRRLDLDGNKVLK